MKLHAGLLVPPRELSSRMQVRVSICLLLQMTSHLCLLILSGLAASSQLGLEDVFFSPQDQTVREGEGVFFRCVSGESSPLASITWLKDGKVVTRGRQIQGDFGGGHQKKTSGTLHLFNVTLEDDGVYVCVTHNPSLNISKSSKRAKLTVQGVPRRLQFIQGPDNITVAIGTEVSMHCSVLGFPVPMVHWFKDGCLLMNCSASFSLQDNGQLLTFRNVSKEDEGSYHCEASNQKETIRSQPASLLPAEMDWSFVQQPTNLTVKSGKNVTVTCRPPYSRPAAQVSWFKNSQLLSPAGHVTMLPSGDLFFHSVQEYDSGSYFCRASNTHLQRFLTSRPATLTVLAPPSVKLWPQVLTVSLGARVVLECQVSGHPLPSISWMKRGHSKQTGGKISLGQRNATLHIQSVRSYDEGVYVCEATNMLGQSHSTALLRVAVSPVIVGFKSQVSCTIGTSVVLTCRAAGILPITYTWTRGRAETQVPISPTEGRHIDEHGALHISSVQYSDVGEYYCIAENRAGRHQKRMILTITAEDQPADRGKQTRLVLSASTSDSKQHPVSKSSDSIAEQHLTTTHHPHVQEKHNETAFQHKSKKKQSVKGTSPDSPTTFPTFSRKARAELNMPSRLLARVLHHRLKQPTISPTQSLLTQMQPPILLPPPHLNFQLEDLHTSGVPVTSKPPFIAHSEPAATQSLAPEAETLQSPLNESRSHLRQMSSKFQHSASDKLFAVSSSSDSATHAVLRVSPIPEMSVSQQPSKLRVSGPSGILKENSYMTTPTPNPVTQMKVRSSDSVTLTITSETSFQPLQPSPARSQTTQTHLQHSFTLSFRPKFHLELSTVQYNLPSTELPSSSVTKPQTSVYLSTTTSATSTLSQTQTESRATQHPQLSLSTIHPRDQAFHPSVLDPEVVQQVNRSYWLNTTQKSTPAQPELTNWLRRNTSQSPMTSNDPRVKQQSPSWLPMLEKHDIPIVVGVGVSLAFIFITVTFYSVVQKNEPAPTSRAAQRNLGVPIRHAERRAAGRTYENRAFEDDDCVAVIEQSPNTSDTRARPPGPSLVTVQVEPMFESLQEDTQPSLDNHSVTVEMYPEPILDTKIDPSLEEEKGCSLSQPSIQLHCAEDCTSNRGDNQSPWRQDTLPPPSPLISRSPSPSPPSRREEGVHSSLTLQSAEPCVAPIHHSLSISHGNPPLLLSHNVSVGLTTVAVDVHFYPAATASMAVGTSTHINSVSNSSSVTAPLFSPTLANSQENDQSASRLHHCK